MEHEKGPGPGERIWTEEVDVAPAKLVDRIKALASEATVRNIRVCKPGGDVAIEIPVAAGAAVAGVMVFAAPVIAALAALAAMTTNYKLQIVRAAPPADDDPQPPAST
ncbi:MAG: DUF4342 domain-containing protein [Pseudomonadota bacterium]